MAKRAQEAQRKGFPSETCVKEEQLSEGLTVWPPLLYLAAQERCELGHDPYVPLLLFMGYRYTSPEFLIVVTG